MRKREVWVDVVLAAFSVFIGMVFYLSRTPHYEPIRPLPLPDKEAFKSFYSEIFQKAKLIDEAYQPYGEAMEVRDWTTAARTGGRILPHLEEYWEDIYGMNIPDLQNDTAEAALREGKKLLVSAYMNKVMIVRRHMDILDKPSHITGGLDMKGYGDKYESQLIVARGRLREAGSELGYASDELAAMVGEAISKR